jgi:hypothetical protein
MIEMFLDCMRWMRVLGNNDWIFWSSPNMTIQGNGFLGAKLLSVIARNSLTEFRGNPFPGSPRPLRQAQSPRDDNTYFHIQVSITWNEAIRNILDFPESRI